MIYFVSVIASSLNISTILMYDAECIIPLRCNQCQLTGDFALTNTSVYDRKTYALNCDKCTQECIRWFKRPVLSAAMGFHFVLPVHLFLKCRKPLNCILWINRTTVFLWKSLMFYRRNVIFSLDGLRVSILTANLNHWVNLLFNTSLHIYKRRVGCHSVGWHRQITVAALVYMLL